MLKLVGPLVAASLVAIKAGADRANRKVTSDFIIDNFLATNDSAQKLDDGSYLVVKRASSAIEEGYLVEEKELAEGERLKLPRGFIVIAEAKQGNFTLWYYLNGEDNTNPVKIELESGQVFSIINPVGDHREANIAITLTPEILIQKFPYYQIVLNTQAENTDQN